MPFAVEAFSTLGDVTALEGRSITAQDVRDCEILAIRSTTKVNKELLQGSRVRFVGTATIGTDHLDIDYLEKNNIRWCFSPGCNANSVSEYITAALLSLANRHGFQLRGKTIGIVGVGNVGSRVARKARALGLRVLLCDPPRARREGVQSGPFVDFDTITDKSDIITFHVPITREGPDKTFHMADDEFFRRVQRGCIIINAARGAVIDSDSLIRAIRGKSIAHCVLDTWEGEPHIREDLLPLVDIATPHIAGHSFDGKVAGTFMVYQEACRFLGVEQSWSPQKLLPPPIVPHISVPEHLSSGSDETVLWYIVKKLYDIEEDDAGLRAETTDRAALFDMLRKKYHIRREFRFTTISANYVSAQLRETVKQLGFRKAG